MNRFITVMLLASLAFPLTVISALVTNALIVPTPVPCINPPPLWVNRVACTQTAAAQTPTLTATPANSTQVQAATALPATQTATPFMPDTLLIPGGALGVPYTCEAGGTPAFPLVVFADGRVENCRVVPQGATPTRIQVTP